MQNYRWPMLQNPIVVQTIFGHLGANEPRLTALARLGPCLVRLRVNNNLCRAATGSAARIRRIFCPEQSARGLGMSDTTLASWHKQCCLRHTPVSREVIAMKRNKIRHVRVLAQVNGAWE